MAVVAATTCKLYAFNPCTHGRMCIAIQRMIVQGAVASVKLRCRNCRISHVLPPFAHKIGACPTNASRRRKEKKSLPILLSVAAIELPGLQTRRGPHHAPGNTAHTLTIKNTRKCVRHVHLLTSCPVMGINTTGAGLYAQYEKVTRGIHPDATCKRATRGLIHAIIYIYIYIHKQQQEQIACTIQNRRLR